jgi:hypothetical protein
VHVFHFAGLSEVMFRDQGSANYDPQARCDPQLYFIQAHQQVITLLNLQAISYNVTANCSTDLSSYYNWLFRRFCKMAKTDYQRRHVRPSVCRRVRTWMSLEGFWWNLMFVLFRKSVEKIQVLLKSDKNTGYLTWRLSRFITIPRWFLHRMRNISNKSCIEN